MAPSERTIIRRTKIEYSERTGFWTVWYDGFRFALIQQKEGFVNAGFYRIIFNPVLLRLIDEKCEQISNLYGWVNARPPKR